MKYLFRSSAEKQFAKLDPQIQNKIIKKLEFFLSAPNPLVFAERLVHYETGQYRFRIGDYRIIFDVEDEVLVVLALGHRREVYK